MGMNVKTLLMHLRERQVEHGVNAFNFHHVLLNNKLVRAAYSDEAKPTIEGRSLITVLDNMDISPPTPIPSPRKSSRKKATKRKGSQRTPSEVKQEDMAVLLTTTTPLSPGRPEVFNNLPALVTTNTPLAISGPTPGASSSGLTMLPSQPALPSHPLQFPADLPLGLPPNPFHPSFPSYGFPYNQHQYNHHQYMSFILHQQQSGNPDFKPPVGDGYPLVPWPSAFPQQNIDPQLLPPGEPIFSFPFPQPQLNRANVATVGKETQQSEKKTPSSKNKRTPKRKRSASPVPEDNTPSRSGRSRKPTQKYLDSLEIERQ
jgi:hypothetical protein